MKNEKKAICHDCKKLVDSWVYLHEGEKDPAVLCLPCVEKDMSSQEIEEFENQFKEQLKK